MKLVIATAVLSTLLVSVNAVQAAPPASNTGPALDLPLDQDTTEAALDKIPSNDDLNREYPPIPLMMGLDGAATMTCKVSTAGQLNECHVVSESPDGLGFGAATVRTSAYFHVRPATHDGKPTEGTISIPLRWHPNSSEPALPPIQVAPAAPAALALGRRLVELEGIGNFMYASWQEKLQQQAVMMMSSSSNAQASQAVLDAFQEGLHEAIDGELDRQAHEFAAQESEADLKAAIAFLQTAAGRAFIKAQNRVVDDAPKNGKARIMAAARAHYCPDGVCPAMKSTAADR